MDGIFSRTEALIGAEAVRRLNNSRVAVFGAGGVGGYVIEALARSGVGAIDVIDGDKFCPSNLNRQILATQKTLGRNKAEAAVERINDINPQCAAKAHVLFYLPETENAVDFSQFDYIVDAIDSVAGKLKIIENAKSCGVPVISCMGTGNKLNPAAFKVADVSQTSVCPLAKVMRRELRKRGICGVKVVFSEEQPVPANTEVCGTENRTPASCAFVPSSAGLIIAAEVVKDLCCPK